MALSKKIGLGNGVVTNYHRVVSVNTITNVQDTLEIASYTSQAKREAEQSALAAGEQVDVFISTRYIAAPYGACPTITRAYEWVKANVEDFAGAEDVYDDDDPSDEVTGEELISMIEEVM